MPTQLSGADFLASRRAALLADEPRVGKTGAAIIAADYIFARRILIVTTASGRAVWRRAFHDWSTMERSIGVVGVDEGAEAKDVSIVSWASASFEKVSPRGRDVIILDEAHVAKTPTARRTESVFGKLYDGGREMLTGGAIVTPDDRFWCLTGTPAPHDPGDLWCMLRAGFPECLKALGAWPDVTKYDDFRRRYCIIRMKKISNWNKIPVVIGGQNLEELHARMKGFILRRTQSDIGIRPPSYEILPLIVSAAQRREADGDLDRKSILDAAAAGKTKELEMDLGPLRRITGGIKAHVIVEAAAEELNNGLDKLVIFFWHRDVGDILQRGLEKFGVCCVDGDTPPRVREGAVKSFNESPKARVFLGQIKAAGEALDLSAAAVLWFAETSFTPADMMQAAQRISNVNQKRNTFVKVCTLEGTIDDAIQASLMRLWTAIKGVIK